MLGKSALLGLVCLTMGPVAAVAAPSTPLMEASGSTPLVHEVQYRGDYYRDRRWDDDGYWHRRRYCERLRRACLYKDDRGEWGQGNCRRYRYECGGRRW